MKENAPSSMEIRLEKLDLFMWWWLTKKKKKKSPHREKCISSKIPLVTGNDPVSRGCGIVTDSRP